MDVGKIKLLAFDLDGTLTQHRSHMDEAARMTLDNLSISYNLLMVGAGGCMRIYEQMGQYPIDIIGNYGMELSRYDKAQGKLTVTDRFISVPDKESVEQRGFSLRKRFGYMEYKGLPMEFHDSGMITFPLLGTGAAIEDKLNFDPDRTKRRAIYHEVMEAFPEYTVFVGGTSSFDMTPSPYNKLYAVDCYCKKHGLSHEEVAYFGDDWEVGGGDRQLYTSDIPFIVVHNYRDFPMYAGEFL